MRAGAQALSLLSVAFNFEALTALADGPKPRAEVSRVLGHPPETTMRTHLKRLQRLGIVDCRRRPGFPGPMDLSLGVAGQDLLLVASTLERWLARAPGGAVIRGPVASRRSTKALVDGWSTGMLRALAARPLTLTELDGLITDLTYPSLERRLMAMREVGLLQPLPASSRGRPLAVTDWLREAIIPLAAAVRWEGRHLTDATAMTSRDIEAAFLIALPLLRLPSSTSGSCRFLVEVGVDGRGGFVGVTAEFDHGRLRSASSRLVGAQEASLSGSPAAWISALLDGVHRDLEISGERGLAETVAHGLRMGAVETDVETARGRIRAGY